MTREELIERICPADSNYDCSTGKSGMSCSRCDELLNKWLNEYEAQVRAEAIEFVVDEIIFPLLNECDRALWEHIDYIPLAEKFIEALNKNPYPTVKNHKEKRRKYLKKWVMEQLEEQMKEKNKLDISEALSFSDFNKALSENIDKLERLKGQKE